MLSDVTSSNNVLSQSIRSMTNVVPGWVLIGTKGCYR